MDRRAACSGTVYGICKAAHVGASAVYMVPSTASKIKYRAIIGVESVKATWEGLAGLRACAPADAGIEPPGTGRSFRVSNAYATLGPLTSHIIALRSRTHTTFTFAVLPARREISWRAPATSTSPPAPAPTASTRRHYTPRKHCLITSHSAWPTPPPKRTGQQRKVYVSQSNVDLTFSTWASSAQTPGSGAPDLNGCFDLNGAKRAPHASNSVSSRHFPPSIGFLCSTSCSRLAENTARTLALRISNFININVARGRGPLRCEYSPDSQVTPTSRSESSLLRFERLRLQPRAGRLNLPYAYVLPRRFPACSSGPIQNHQRPAPACHASSADLAYYRHESAYGAICPSPPCCVKASCLALPFASFVPGVAPGSVAPPTRTFDSAMRGAPESTRVRAPHTRAPSSSLSTARVHFREAAPRFPGLAHCAPCGADALAPTVAVQWRCGSD
ncbi:hypothetical protein HYPSUDRAFT_204953 [Hypholoma sublateritium FD-334 SS-4]|uniref:Uncharacterized protein n=1 Tax=Hypholoma sublateritium (strain FD-334 SS-4) TaxID=945553 RepID=A0A0D2M738_HYPSF|nr:hypothetical protein HYPSUDRAFT_204953 [Hypholoma sublateritium FD-334 SS-4]